MFIHFCLLLIHTSHSRYPSFSFSSYVDHRDLHSFPTRRSSDLNAFGGGFNGELVPPVVPNTTPSAIIPDGSGLGPVLDRKSTRLNSSHRCISYAVFCLKKKKKKKKKK